uniref:Serum response factor homolog n=1 Tax=Cacopsylla melanoneura TaxID=428564 RepID=A0A8D8M3R9_9HEMI
MDTPTGGGRDSRFSMGYNMSILNNESSPEMYPSSVHSRASTSITSGLSRTLINNNNNNCSSNVQRGLKRTSDNMCYDIDGRSSMTNLTGDCGSDIVDEGYSPSTQKGSPPSNGKKTKGRVKIKMEYIDNKLRRYTTFSKRKTGIMKKAYELSTLTGTQVMLLVASETGHVYTFATRKLQPMITSDAGKALIQTCLNSPDPNPGGAGDQRMSATGFEETELSYNIGDDEQKEDLSSSARSDCSGDESSGSRSGSPDLKQEFFSYELANRASKENLARKSSSPSVPETTSAPNAHQTRISPTVFARSNFILPPSSSNSIVYPTSHQSTSTSSPSGVILNLQQIQAGGFDLRTLSTGQRFITIPVPLNVPPAHQSSSPADLSNKVQRK